MNFNKLKKLIQAGENQEFIKEILALINSKEAFDPTERDKEFHCTLLDWAAICDQTEIITFLCERFPNLLNIPNNMRSSVAYAARHGSLKSLLVLLKHTIALEHKDQNQQTALDLAIQYQHGQCARELINHGAKLPIQIEELIKLVNPWQYTLYCEPKGQYQLLTKEEIELIKVTDQISTLSLHQKNKNIKKLYHLELNPKHSADILNKLIDKYLYYCNRIYKEKRESIHGVSNPNIIEMVRSSKKKRESLLQIIRLLVAVTKEHNLNQKLLVNDEKAEPILNQFIERMQNLKQRYFGDDLSDNSDSDDEKYFLQYIAQPTEHTKIDAYLKTASKQTDRFWLKTKMLSPKKSGLKDKIIKISSQIRKNPNNNNQLTKIKPIITETLNKDLQDRGKIEYSEKTERNEAIKLIKKINTGDMNQVEDFIAKSKPIFILGTRGINYMLDRWNAKARRYHYRIDESQQPQFSEAVLKTLPYDYYTDLSPLHDYHLNKTENLSLLKEAIRLNKFFQLLNETSLCINNSANHTGDYVFNSVGDCLQDHFSNGVDNHLNNFAKKRETHPNYWGLHLKNSFNPGVAIGSRPYHALKYTFGLKAYYPHSMLPRYWNDGTLEYLHVGKVYLSLHPLQEILAKDGPNNLSIQDRLGKVSIGDQISPEKELSYLSFMPGDRIFHQFIAKFPSFKSEWKNIHEIKYGLDRDTYKAFQYLISITSPETKERNQIIELLAEWLCAYHEVLLIQMAKEEALKRGGILAYINREGKLTLEPENGRIFTRGNSNQELRNEVHTLRELRLELVKHLKKENQDTQSIPGFTLIEINHVTEILNKLLQDDIFLQKITEKIQLTTEEEGLVQTKKTTFAALKKQYGKKILNSLLQNGMYANTFFNSYAKKITYLQDQNHLYTDFEINALLNKALENIPGIEVYAAQHPLVQGELKAQSCQLFILELQHIFQSNDTAVMPIEVSQNELNNNAYLHMNGIHWNGLVISKIADNQFKVELIDPAHSPEHDANLTALSVVEITNLGPVIAQLLSLIQQAASQSNIIVQIHWLKTQQQSGDLDCGAWTIDNLIRRSQHLSLRTRNEITGSQLRQEHDGQYNNIISPG